MTAMIFFLRLISYTPSLGGVIVPAVQVVQARLGVVDVPAIAQGIRGAEGGGHGAVGGNGRTPGVVAVGDAAAALAHRRQLAAVLPAVGPCAVGQGIAYGVVGDGLPIERRQQVRPISIAVGVGAACCPDVTVF